MDSESLLLDPPIPTQNVAYLFNNKDPHHKMQAWSRKPYHFKKGKKKLSIAYWDQFKHSHRRVTVNFSEDH